MTITLRRQALAHVEASTCAGSYEFILVRQLPDPHLGNVNKGDIVCMRHPNGVTPESMLVRRVRIFQYNLFLCLILHQVVLHGCDSGHSYRR